MAGRPSKTAPEDRPSWAKRLKEARERKGLTQKQLSELVHVSDKAISNWENGTHEPKLAEFETIADATDANLAWLLAGQEPGEPGGADSFPAIVADAEKAHRHFAWALVEAARLLQEVGIQANGPELISFVNHILSAGQDCRDDAEAKEAIARKLASERANLRADLKKVREKIFNPRGSRISD
jgi:transcriptional regulator with XRE-family HTH domain